MPKLQTITPCLWFDGQAEAAVTFYTGIFKNSKITSVSRYTEAGKEIHGRSPGSVMVMMFEIEGQTFAALNGGPMFKFTEAVSFQINFDTQQEIDYYWDKLRAGGPEQAQQCGWLKDKFGLSWQVVPSMMGDFFKGGGEGAQRAMSAMLKMKKLNIAELQRAAAEGED
jgi:predicted 3-demethylubiquinone-9 3-methyltransferase (glyoxalase superfamily)